MARPIFSSVVRNSWMAPALWMVASAASASVVMNATRYIYPEGEKEITVKVSNVGKSPVLSQAWIDDGDAKATPETVDVPFNLTPPIARIEAGKAQTLRIAFTDAELPADRETQFWINVLEVPPKPSDSEAESNHIQLALRYRLKLFYRPKRLQGSAEAAAGAIHWSREGGDVAVRNDSAFHVTVNDASITVDGKNYPVEPFSVAPLSTKRFKVEKLAAAAGKAGITYQTINDYGGFVEHTTTL